MFRRPKIITKGLVSNLPEAINIDIEHLKIGMFIYIKDVVIEGAEFLAPPNSVVVGVKTARAAIVEEEIVEEEVFDLSDLESDIEKADKEGTLLDNLDKKGYSNGKEGTIRVDKENQNTLVFETNDEIIELGRKDEIGDNTLASVDITLMPPEGVDVAPVGTTKGDKPLDVFTVDGVDYTITGRRRDKKGKAVVRVKEVESGLDRRLVGEKAERMQRLWSEQ